MAIAFQRFKKNLNKYYVKKGTHAGLREKLQESTSLLGGIRAVQVPAADREETVAEHYTVDDMLEICPRGNHISLYS